jgi:signal transduction histidine kinase
VRPLAAERSIRIRTRLEDGRSGGTGLGPATAAAAARAHGGTVAYEERPGGGAAFRLRIPTAVLVEGRMVDGPA